MKSLITFLLVTIPLLISAQSWELLKKVEHKGIDKFTMDQVGNIYVTNQQGTVTKYDKTGKLMLEYAPVQVATIHEITASSQLKVTLFYKDLQEFVILNRYLSSPITYQLSDYNLGYVEDVAPNFQQAFWALDISDFSIKLIDPQGNRVLEKKSLAQVFNQHEAEIVSFHSHQNRMYVIDKSSGVHVFDSIGNYVFKLMNETPQEVGFEKDYMYYQKSGFLNLIHLYDGENKRLSLEGLKFSKIGYSNSRLMAITPQGFNLYQYLSGQ